MQGIITGRPESVAFGLQAHLRPGYRHSCSNCRVLDNVVLFNPTISAPRERERYFKLQASRDAETSDVPLASPLCRECGGRRVIKTSSAGYLPCPTCVPWRQRPDYIPGTLITNKDLNLNKIEQAKVLEEETKKKQRRPTIMTEERRMAIKQAMQNRGPLDMEHKRKISNSVRAKYAENPALRQKGRPKKCSICGEEGHNRKTCPKVVQTAAATQKLQNDKKGKRKIRCSICGKEGHNKSSCPEKDKAQANYQGSGSLGEPTHMHSKARTTKEVKSNPADAIFENEIILEKDENVVYPGSQERPDLNSVDTTRPLRPLRGSGVALSSDGSIVFPLPARQEECVQQAASAVRRAWDDGYRRQCLELLLPQSNTVEDRGWPGGIRQQFRAALPMVESFLLVLKSVEGLRGRITAEFLDESDCVGAWQSERLSAVLFPTAETIPSLQRIDDALSGRRLNLIINPQWQLNGQIISDFGFGNSRRQAEKFISSLEYVYYLQRLRVMGDEIRVLRCYPGQWQIYWMGKSARDHRLLAVEREKPSYERLVELLRSNKNTRASLSWIDRFFSSRSFDEIATYSDDAEMTFENEDNRDIVTGEILEKTRSNTSEQ